VPASKTTVTQPARRRTSFRSISAARLQSRTLTFARAAAALAAAGEYPGRFQDIRLPRRGAAII
jgi:hypothetical protein